LKRFASFLVSAFLIAVLMYFVDIENLAKALLSVDPGPLLTAFGLASVVLFVNGFRWALFVRASGFPHSIKSLILIRLIAQGLNAFLPGGVIGDGLQVFMITRRTRVSAAKALTTIVIDRFVALVVNLILLALTIGNSFPHFLSTEATILILVACITVASMGIIILLRFDERISGISGFPAKILKFSLRIAKEFRKALRKPIVLLKCTGLSAVGHLISVGILWQLVNMYFDISFSVMIPLVSMVVFVTLIPLTFMGVGVREAVLYAGLKQFGFTLEEVVAVSLIWLSITLLSNAIFTGCALVLSPEPQSIERFKKKVWPA
jgi:glycosyltransferase 2 family protein